MNLIDMNLTKTLSKIGMAVATIATLSIGAIGEANATTFEFDFNLNNSSKQEILDDNGGTFGTLSFDEDITAGTYFLGDLTNVNFSFNMGNIVVHNPIDDLNNIKIFVSDNGTNLELTRFDDIAGNYFQLENNSTNVAFPNSNNRFYVSAGSQFDGDRSFHAGTFTAISDTRTVPEPTSAIALFAVGTLGITSSLKRTNKQKI